MTPAPYLDLDPALLRDGAEHTRVLLVRHAQQGSTPDGVLPQAWLDAELTPLGLKQAAAVASHLAGSPLAAVYCSHMRRAHRTAEEIAARHALDVVVRRELAEVDVYAGLPLDAWPSDHVGADAWAGMHADFERTRQWEVFGFGETGKQLRARVTGAVEAVIAAHPGATVAIVCHGGAINAYLAEVLGINADMFFLPAHASVTELRASPDGRRVVETLNDRHGLEVAGLLTS